MSRPADPRLTAGVALSSRPLELLRRIVAAVGLRSARGGYARLFHVFIVTGVLAASLTACSLVPSAYRVDLFQSKWSVSDQAGQPVATVLALSFNENGHDGVVSVKTPCGAVDRGVDMDSDGGSISFSGQAATSGDCSNVDREATIAFLLALDGVRDWKVVDANHIVLTGTKDIGLTRQQ